MCRRWKEQEVRECLLKTSLRCLEVSLLNKLFNSTTNFNHFHPNQTNQSTINMSDNLRKGLGEQASEKSEFHQPRRHPLQDTDLLSSHP